MKAVLASLAFVSLSAFAAPKATLRVPVMLDLTGNNDKPIAASVINPKLVAKGLKALPLYVELVSGEQNQYKKIEAVGTLAESELPKIGYKEGRLASGYVPGDIDQRGAETCFTGDGTLVADLTKEVTDIVYSDQYGIHGWKYKNVVRGDDGELDEESLKWLNDNSKTWKNWNKTQDAVLILSHVGDDGDDVSESVIKRCK
ncbi:MAG: hypothetical protein ACJ76H_12200 [Bacteriovoracaceae bacterium]